MRDMVRVRVRVGVVRVRGQRSPQSSPVQAWGDDSDGSESETTAMDRSLGYDCDAGKGYT